MKFLTVVAFISLSSFVFAQDQEKPFDEVKQHRLSNIDKRIGYLNELKSCVGSSTDHASMKKCNETHKAEMQALKSENSGWRSSKKAEWQAKKAQRKNKK